MSTNSFSLETIQQSVGKELGVSNWLTIDQERINQFADCTGDHQWIHVDVERAKRESPFGTTIAHGYLTLSLLASSEMKVDIAMTGISRALNYGLDRVRFMSPVKVASRIRKRIELLSAEPQKNGGVLLKYRNTIEIEGESKPAMVAETLVLLFP